MSKSLKINGRTIIPVDQIRLIKPVTEADRDRIAERYEVDAGKFQLQIEFADKSTKLAAESLDDVRGQGIGLVNLGSDRYVPAANIKTAEPFTKDDAQKAKEKDYTLNDTFRARVETTAGPMLSTATPEQVIQRRERALGLNAGDAKGEAKSTGIARGKSQPKPAA